MKKTRNYFHEEIDQNELTSNENKKLCMTLNYIENFFTLVFASTICVSISAFASLVDIITGVMSSTIGSNICAIIAIVKKYKLIIKEKKKMHDEIVSLLKSRLD